MNKVDAAGRLVEKPQPAPEIPEADRVSRYYGNAAASRPPPFRRDPTGVSYNAGTRKFTAQVFMFYINNSSKCAFLGDVFFWQSEDHRSVHAAECESKRVAAPPRPRRGHSLETSRGASAATTWTFRGGLPLMNVAVAPRLRRGYSVGVADIETGDFGAAA